MSLSAAKKTTIEEEKLKKKIKRLLEDAEEDDGLAKKIQKVLDESKESGYEEDFDDAEDDSDEVETDENGLDEVGDEEEMDEVDEDFDKCFEESIRKKMTLLESPEAAKKCGILKGMMDDVPEAVVSPDWSSFYAKDDEIQWNEDDMEWNYMENDPREVVHLDFNEIRGKARIKLESTDGVIYEMDEDVACKSGLIKDIRTDSCECDLDYPIRVSLGDLLKKTMEYCHKYRHVEYKPFGKDMELNDWDRTYLDIPYEELPDLLRAADYLIIPGLVEIIIRRMTDIAKGRTAKEILEIFKIKKSLSSEDEERLEVAVEDPFQSDEHRYYILCYLSRRE